MQSEELPKNCKLEHSIDRSPKKKYKRKRTTQEDVQQVTKRSKLAHSPFEARHLVFALTEDDRPLAYLVTIKKDEKSYAGLILSTLDELLEHQDEKWDQHVNMFNNVISVLFDEPDEYYQECLTKLNKYLKIDGKITSKKDLGEWKLLTGSLYDISNSSAQMKAFHKLGPVVTHMYTTWL